MKTCSEKKSRKLRFSGLHDFPHTKIKKRQFVERCSIKNFAHLSQNQLGFPDSKISHLPTKNPFSIFLT